MVADCNAALTHCTVCPSSSRSDRLFMLLLGGTVMGERMGRRVVVSSCLRVKDALVAG